MISMLIGLILTSLTIFASGLRIVDVQVGVDQSITIASPILTTSAYNFIFSRDDYSFRLANKMITKEVTVAILSPEYALKAVWTSADLDIVGKVSKHYLYLVSREKNKKINKESIKNKKVFLLENSADEFYFEKYLGGIQYEKVLGTFIELMNSVDKKERSDFLLMDSKNYLLLKKKEPTISALKIEAGVYYIVTLMRENEIMFNSLTRDAFKINKINYYNLTKSDLEELKDLNNSISKKKFSQEYFEELFLGLMQR